LRGTEIAMPDATTTLSELRAAVITFRDERDWVRFHTPKNLTMAVMTEAAELAELYVWQGEAEPPTAERVERSGQEMADVLIYLLCLADVLNVDLASAVTAKLTANAARYPADAVRGSVAAHDQTKLANKNAG
jgi:NTP pyrophosphatase (non-canonical NTP hydrolase)